jgi:hypothetical protein
MLDRAAELFQRFVDMGFVEYDVARMVDVVSSLPARKAHSQS